MKRCYHEKYTCKRKHYNMWMQWIKVILKAYRHRALIKLCAVSKLLGCQSSSLSAETDHCRLEPFDVHCLTITGLFRGVAVFSNVWTLCLCILVAKSTIWPPCLHPVVTAISKVSLLYFAMCKTVFSNWHLMFCKETVFKAFPLYAEVLIFKYTS